jgi:hypothetical protein
MRGSLERRETGNESRMSVMSNATAMSMPVALEELTAPSQGGADPSGNSLVSWLSASDGNYSSDNDDEHQRGEEEEKTSDTPKSGNKMASPPPPLPPRPKRPPRLTEKELAEWRTAADNLPAPPSTPNAQDQASGGEGSEASDEDSDPDLESSSRSSLSKSSDNWSDLKPAPCARAKKVFSVAAPFTVSAILAAFIYLNVQMLMAREEGNQTDFEEDNTWITHFFPMIAVILSMKAVFSISDRKHAFSQAEGKCKDAMVIAAELVLMLGFMLASLSQNALSLGFLDNATEELRNVTGETIVPALNAGASGNLLSFFLLLNRDAFSSSQKGALTVFRGSDAFLLSALMGHSALAAYDPAYAKDLITQQEVVLTLIASLFVANLATGVLASLQGCIKPKPTLCCARLKGVRDDRSQALLEPGERSFVDTRDGPVFKGCCP